MKRRTTVRAPGRALLIGLCLAVIALFGLAVTAPADASAGQTHQATSSTVPAWTGTFDSFHSSGWNSGWGLTSDSAQCPIAVGTYSCNWGYENLKPISDATSPAGQALQVTYPAKSGPPSCTVSSSGCVLGGGQFYQDLTSNGQSALASSPTIDLKYAYKFPVGFDFGGKTAGKMPGLYGGPPGCESGGQHCSNGWSTRYMWRGGSSSAPNGELYFYGGSGSGYGADVCLGNWTFPADGNWHTIEQLVNVSTGAVTIWSDGKQVCQVTETFSSPVSGAFFSTFHGGHDTSWSPTKTTTSEFADFSLATNGPQTPAPAGGPAAPSGLAVSAASSSSLNLSWTEANTSDPAVSYKVYEGSTVVATPTTTSATISGLGAGSSHTYTVTAVDASGVESTPSAAVTGSTTGGTGGPATPTGLTVSAPTSSSLNLSWTEANTSDAAVSYKVYEGSSVVATSTTTSATISGLAAGSSHTYTVTAVDASGVESAHSTSATGTTSGSGGGGGGLTASIAKTKDWGSGFTDTVTLTNTSATAVNGWNVQFDLDASENIESAAPASYTSSGTHWTLTNASSDATVAPGASVTFQFSGDYGSAGYLAPTGVTVNGQGSGGGSSPAVPTALTLTGSTASSLGLGWTETNTSDPAVSYKVYEGSTVVATASTTSATISGLTSCTSHTYTVAALDAAGVQSAQSGPVTGTTSGCVNTPATPTGLSVTGSTASSISLGWTETNTSDPAVSYRVYEGGLVVDTPTTTSATISGLTAGSSHTYTLTAVDAAGVESAQSASVTGTTSGSGGGSGFTQALIDSAVAAPPFAWAAPTSSVPRPGTNPANIGEAAVLYYLALVDHQAPGSKATNGTSVDSALLAQVRSLIAGGHEPDADGGLEMWGQAPVAQALLLLKNGPAWSELTAAEQNKVSLLEAAMGYGSNYAYNDANNFSSGICGFGNFSKGNNPNYRDGGVDTEIAAIQFFGASTWDSMLSSFNDATVASQLNAAGLTSAGGCFTTVGSAANSAIARPFVYQGHGSSDLMGLWSVLAGDTFDKTAQSTVSGAHIADGTTSPYDGQCCMGHEFNSTDSSGLRSSALYVFEGWMNVTGSRVVMDVLGNFNPSAASTESQFHIGTLDLKYKLDHGYICVALNQPSILVDDHGNPSTDGPNVKGFLYDWDAYSASGSPQS
ncbi:fibronectin type III domain-containing protein [Streptacidiphilus fuscans]|uniref:Cellulose binding domain-containing protein n=1 Tax=Streptacidiphilus fuscans TaxID=2789292 RepID=A0A931B2D2_9ACTN|nr:cellulose binding domain-containing protein [Streptacidiphilus fuscans]MBF9069824.1 cellulose binding domain-containing protein [Streptacidiphilus fuscans]